MSTETPVTQLLATDQVDRDVHTPGPWKALTFGSGNTLVYGPTTEHSPICKLYDWDDYRAEYGWSVECNAQLIEAAPDLYAACLGLIRSIDEAEKGSPHQMMAISEAEQALRKAGAKICLREWERN